MPDWVKDEKKWKQAIAIFANNNKRGPSSSRDYAQVTGIYKKLGGRISSEGISEAISLMGKFKEDFPMDAFQKGLTKELEEHPQVDDMAAAQLVLDHIKDDPSYYDKDSHEEIQELAANVTSTDNGHRHKWHQDDIYTSMDNGHQHKLDFKLDIALEAEGHFHRLLREPSDEGCKSKEAIQMNPHTEIKNLSEKKEHQETFKKMSEKSFKESEAEVRSKEAVIGFQVSANIYNSIRDTDEITAYVGGFLPGKASMYIKN